MSDATILLWLFTWLSVIALFFIPTIVANKRRHHQRLAIAVLNISGFGIAALTAILSPSMSVRLWLGLIALGWIGAIVWACTAVQKQSAT